MPRKKTSATQKKVIVDKLTCTMCGKSQAPSNHYQSFNPLHATGYLPYCKKCLKEMCYDSRGNFDLEGIKKMLKLIDRPFLYDLIKNSGGDSTDIPGTYMKNIQMPQYKYLGWSASAFNTATLDEEYQTENTIGHQVEYNFSKEVLDRWRDHALEDIIHLEDFYTKMKEDNRIESVQDEIYLKKLAVINLEQDKAGKNRDWGMYEKLGTMFSKFMMDAKLRAQDRSEADRTGGIRSFGALYSEVEKDDFIPPWETYRKINGAKQDIIDKTIMHIENFVLRLNKHERMTTPPSDVPMADNDELDSNSNISYVDIEVTKDDIFVHEDGDKNGD